MSVSFSNFYDVLIGAQMLSFEDKVTKVTLAAIQPEQKHFLPASHLFDLDWVQVDFACWFQPVTPSLRGGTAIILLSEARHVRGFVHVPLTRFYRYIEFEREVVLVEQLVLLSQVCEGRHADAEFLHLALVLLEALLHYVIVNL